MRLDFAIVGPQRSGTTWTYQYLRTHPDVFVSPVIKESRFFDLAFERGIDWYAGLFEDAVQGDVVGEVAPTYFHNAEARGRLVDAFPSCKIVVTLREPIGRLVSLFHHLRRTGQIASDQSLLAALESEPLLVATSRYASHLSAWRESSGESSVHILRFDDLESDPVAYSQQLCDTLGVAWSAPESEAPAGQAVEPRSYWLARTVSATSRSLRRVGAHRLVNLGKRWRLRELVLGSRPLDAEVDDATAAAIWDRIGPDILALEQYGVDLDVWRGHWRALGLGD